MGNIKKIFIRDVKALLRNPFALLIAGGLCILPALYAWFNIYSNWDPYGNTGNIQIAVASEDKGYTDLDGNAANMADAVMDTLKENASIGWVMVDKKDEAVEGVRNGSYYAAVVFAEDFTECMYHGFLEGLKRPSVTYYENEKKNAVATKITDTAVSTLQQNINEQYITTVVSRVFDKQQEAADHVESADLVETVVEKLRRAQNTTDDFSMIVRSLVQANERLTASVEDAGSDMDTLRDNLGNVQTAVEDVPDTRALTDDWNARNSQALQSLGQALTQLEQARREEATERKNTFYQQASAQLSSAKSSLDSLIDSIQSVNAATVDISQGIVLTQLESQSQALGAMIGRLDQGVSSRDPAVLDEAGALLRQQATAVQQVLQGSASQLLAKLGSELQQVSKEMTQVIGNLREDIDLAGKVLDNGVTAVGLMDQSFSGIAKELDLISGKLEQITEIVSGLDDAQLAQQMLSFIQGDPDEYGAFFAEPVTIETQAVYPVDNYGSGVAPFYTTLALWVGGVVLVSLIKVKAYTQGLDSPRPCELFLGRYLLFLVLALAQAAITVWGNFYLLHIQCMYPRRFLLAALLTSVTFSLFIYALTISFGDLGKAIIVVLMVIQIAGSSGTYPIEILPRFYQKMYIFFPFPYAINAMREAIAGMYEEDYTLYLLRLLLFAAAALALGLVIRLPFRKFYRFIERRMEDTEMM